MRSLSLMLLCIFCLARPLLAEEDGAQERSFSYTINTLVFGDYQDPAHSTQNPDNAFLGLYRYSTNFHVRPDFLLERPEISAVFKPRFIAAYQWWEDGAPKGMTASPNRAFVNEWRVQAKASPSLFLSFGKEKLLWGPSFLASPSNILFKDIEKLNPKAEVEGKYLAKVVYIPNNALTVNAITETQQEENSRHETLKPIQALKADFLGSNYLISMIGYFRKDDRFSLGSFGQRTASDALVVYYDGIVSKGTDALYPGSAPGNPFGGAFVKKYDASERLFPVVTVGGSYTFLSGSTFSIEGLYNGQGYDDAEAAAYYRIRRNAHDHFFDSGAVAGLSRMTLNDTLNNGLPFLRRYYLMGQFQVREIKNVLDIILRYTHGLEEHAGQASTIVEWRVSDRIQAFNINTIAVDRGRETEFNAVLAQSVLAGIELHF